ncbi:uncharacterized protein BDCG_07033 [Blastomyces dermatitidis ER-3]|uniref:Uncharacterized protein n=1 Tax=Ajellomyces dermatitidis (strain ER-3 / ATCC MYA-2586) TaxID=559297 RepID=A0ABP2F772_AJEDR|nr:uncharacterized protein BDCG_07033 [Blastomyces dermatitidis ER-3]EEQ91913.2 hypothetical protein BDCG_07033 [Blastomyces dermatitidis ER-3]
MGAGRRLLCLSPTDSEGRHPGAHNLPNTAIDPGYRRSSGLKIRCRCFPQGELTPSFGRHGYRIGHASIDELVAGIPGDVCASLNRVHLSPQIDMNLQYSLRGSWCMVGWAIRPPPNNWNWLCGYEMSRVACGGYHLLEPSLFYTLQLGVKDSEVYGSPSRTVTISMEERNVASKASLTRCHLLRKGEATTSLANRWRTISTRLLPISNYLQQRGRRPLCLFSRCIVKSQRLGKETTERYSNSQGMFTSTLDEADRPTVTVFICEESLRSGSERATQVQYRVFTTLV